MLHKLIMLKKIKLIYINNIINNILQLYIKKNYKLLNTIKSTKKLLFIY